MGSGRTRAGNSNKLSDTGQVRARTYILGSTSSNSKCEKKVFISFLIWIFVLQKPIDSFIHPGAMWGTF